MAELKDDENNFEIIVEAVVPSFIDCDDAPIFDTLQFVETFDDCEECNALCWIIKICDSEETICVSSQIQDLTVYNNEVISFIDPNDNETKCGLVMPELCRDLICVTELLEIVIIDCFDDCETCTYVPPLEDNDFSQRTVYPGYNTPACSIETWDKTKCKWSESLYQDMATKKYGIEFCCDPADQKWYIKNELIKLAAIYDEEICTTNNCTNVCADFNCSEMTITQLELYFNNGTQTNMLNLIDNINEYSTENPDYYQVLLEAFDCYLNNTYSICPEDLSPEACYQQLIDIQDSLTLCSATVAEIISSYGHQYPEETVLWERVPAGVLESINDWFDAIIKTSPEDADDCNQSYYLNEVLVNYTDCNGNSVTTLYNEIDSSPGIEILPGSELIFYMPNFQSSEAVFDEYLKPLFEKGNCL